MRGVRGLIRLTLGMEGYKVIEAEDYTTKPFEPLELLPRVDPVLKRQWISLKEGPWKTGLRRIASGIRFRIGRGSHLKTISTECNCGCHSVSAWNSAAGNDRNGSFRRRDHSNLWKTLADRSLLQDLQIIPASHQRMP